MNSQICILCEHFHFECGCDGYSEYTPGYGAVVECQKHHWTIDMENCTEGEYRQYMLTARTCEDYKEISVP